MNDMELEIAIAEAKAVLAGKSRSHVRAAAIMAPALIEMHRRLEIAFRVADELRAAYRRVDPVRSWADEVAMNGKGV